MKIRNGFVSNSSSSSFILLKRNLNDNCLIAINDFIAKHNNTYETEIKEDSKCFYGHLESHNPLNDDDEAANMEMWELLNRFGVLHRTEYASEYCGSLSEVFERLGMKTDEE